MSDPQKDMPPDNVIGRLPEFACSHWTGYGIESELCQNYLHLLSALKAIVRDLPVRRDWLDPNIERHAKYVIAESEKP